MSCGSLSGAAPFLTRTELLRTHPLDGGLLDRGEDADADGVFLSWFLDLRASGLELLLCPDVMYQTYSGGAWPPRIAEGGWRKIAQKHGFQAVVATDFSPKVDYSFRCDQVGRIIKMVIRTIVFKGQKLLLSQVGLECSPRSQQTDAHLLPWCCIDAYAHILRELESAAQVYIRIPPRKKWILIFVTLFPHSSSAWFTSLTPALSWAPSRLATSCLGTSTGM